MIQLTDEQNFHLSQESYLDGNMVTGQEIKTETGKWVVIKAKNNDISGLQAIAVVPKAEYVPNKKDYENVVFISRGSSELNDWETNIGNLALRQKPLEITDRNNAIVTNQFVGYERFVDMTLSEYNIKDYLFTGNSLEGALAQYMAVLKDKIEGTFSASRAYRLLLEEYKKYYGFFLSDV